MLALQLLHDKHQAFTTGENTLVERLHNAEGIANETF